MKCPRCHGSPESVAFVKFASGGCRLVKVGCELCGSTGTVAPEVEARYREGRRRRDERMVRGVSLREEAKRLGITAAELSRLERGTE